MATEGELFLEFLNRSSEVETRYANSHGSGSSSTSELACTYYKMLTKKQVQDLIRKYEVDLALFQYSAEKYLECTKDYNEIPTKPPSR